MLIGTADVAKLLGVTETTVRNYRSRKILKAISGKRGLRTVYQFPLADVQAFAAEHGLEIDETALGEVLERDHDT